MERAAGGYKVVEELEGGIRRGILRADELFSLAVAAAIRMSTRPPVYLYGVCPLTVLISVIWQLARVCNRRRRANGIASIIPLMRPSQCTHRRSTPLWWCLSSPFALSLSLFIYIYYIMIHIYVLINFRLLSLGLIPTHVIGVDWFVFIKYTTYSSTFTSIFFKIFAVVNIIWFKNFFFY